MKEACLEKDQLQVIFEIATDMGKLVKTSAQRNGKPEQMRKTIKNKA